jgi:beta-lactam-binding protein with PASTA domain
VRRLTTDGLSTDPDWANTPTDTHAPRVTSTSPAAGAPGVARGTNVRATFSEQMDPASISKATFKLFKCPSATSTNCTTQITNVTLSKSTDGLRATLNPYGTSSTLLAPRTKYKAVVTTGAKDLAGNALDQNATTSGNQQKVWFFTTARN